jgi:hypothetical protein
MVVNATTPTMLSLPSQILRAKIPSSSEEEGQQRQQQQLWLYEGALYDPLDGRQVAKVQGIELIRPIMNTTNLAIDSILRHPNATYDDAQTLWSQKVFCYTKTKSTRNNENENENGDTTNNDILRSVRIRPQSPRKDVPLDQAVAVYETATTFISRRRRHKQNKDDEDVDLLIHSEFPNGQTMWGNTQELRCQQNTINNNPSSSTSSSLRKTSQTSLLSSTKSGSGNIDFTIFAKIRSKRSPLFAPDLTESDDNDNNDGRRRKKGNGNDDDVIVSPKRSALIQFGSSNDNMESKHKFGARETYSYRNIPLSTTATTTTENPRPLWKRIKLSMMRNNKNAPTTITSSSSSIYYTRYGEGPPFYAPGRMCMLEMQGRPIYDLKEATSILQRLLQKNDDDGSTSGGPVVGFHYRNNQDNNYNNDDATRMTSSSKITAPPSIQTAWNLNKKKRNNNDRRRIGTTTARRMPSSSATNSQQLLRLKVQDPADGSVHGSNDIRTWTRRGQNQVVAIWDRIRASTTLESGN